MREILTWYQSGGPFMAPMVFVAVVGVLLLIEGIVRVARRSTVNSRPFMEHVIGLVRAGRLDEAVQSCADHRSALPDLGLVMLRNRNRDEDDLRHVARAATLTMLPQLTRRLAWLPTLAIIAVLLGIVGAIANLHSTIVESAGSITAAEWAAGVAYALRPLGAGFLTAIPLVLGHALLTYEAHAVIAQLDEFSVRLVNALIERPDVRLGHR